MNLTKTKNIHTIQDMYNKGVIKCRLKKIKISSLKKFSPDTEINFQFPLTVLVGKNGTGKTTLMKSISILAQNQKPQNEFFELDIDDGGYNESFIEYIVDDDIFSYQRIKTNEWGLNGIKVEKLPVICIQSKSMVGAIEKSFLYDDVGKNTKREQKVEYVIRQSKKLKQNILDESAKKLCHFLSDKAIESINFILQKNLKEIKIIKHKYYSGTWANSVFFNDNNVYSEYNAGSGEFLLACIIDKLTRLPENCIVLLDEPEISLHPGAQNRLMQFIIEIVKVKKLQVIIATHSTHIIEDLPKEAIKCFRRTENDVFYVEENINFKNAFIELEMDIKDKKCAIVEDSLAKDIINAIIKNENLQGLIDVEYYSGGADNLKVFTILTYSKTDVKNRHIIFDGDQFKANVSNLSEVLEKDKTIDFYRKEIENVTGIKSSKISWGVDANKKEGRYNEKQEKELIIKYLQFYSNNVFFLPKLIPEDIIYDEIRLKILLGEDKFPSIKEDLTGKEKIKIISDSTGQDIEFIQKDLIYWFIKNKNEQYSKILDIIKIIIERE